MVNELSLRLQGGDTLGALGIAERLREMSRRNRNGWDRWRICICTTTCPGWRCTPIAKYLKRFGQDDQVLDAAMQLEAALKDAVGDVKVARLQDVARLGLQRGDYDGRGWRSSRCSGRAPGHVARNNLSLVQWELGEEQEAILTALAVVEDAPDDLHTLANLVHFLQVCGLEEEMAQAVRKLQALPLTEAAACRKRAEALTFAGDDAGVVACLEEAEKRGGRRMRCCCIGSRAADRLKRS